MSWVHEYESLLMSEIFGMRKLNESCKILLSSHMAIPFTTSRKDTNVPFALFLILDRENHV